MPPLQNTASAPAPAASSPLFAVSPPVTWALLLVPLVLSVAALVVSLLGYQAANHGPDMTVALPPQLFMVQGGQNTPGIYLEPGFVGTGPSDRVDLVSNLALRVEPLGGQSEPADFSWTETGAWTLNDQGALNYVFHSISTPFAVSPGNPQVAVHLFRGPENWVFKAGNYKMTLTAARTVANTPLQTSFSVNFPQAQLDVINQSQGKTFASFPIKP